MHKIPSMRFKACRDIIENINHYEYWVYIYANCMNICTCMYEGTTYFAPDALNISAHWSGSNSSAVKSLAKSAYVKSCL